LVVVQTEFLNSVVQGVHWADLRDISKVESNHPSLGRKVKKPQNLLQSDHFKINSSKMARFIRKVQPSTLRYLYELQLHSVELHVPYEVGVGVTFKNNSKRQETRSTPMISADDQVAQFNGEKLNILATLVKNKETGQPESRSVSLYLIKLRFRPTSSCL
jgi:hypothetical protein